MVGVLLAVPALAVRATSLWDVDLSMHARQSYSRGFSSSSAVHEHSAWLSVARFRRTKLAIVFQSALFVKTPPILQISCTKARHSDTLRRCSIMLFPIKYLSVLLLTTVAVRCGHSNITTSEHSEIYFTHHFDG